MSISFNILNFCLAGNLPPLGGVCVVVEDQGRYLLLRRPEGSMTFPGGFVRWREHPTRTAQREVMEETGLQVRLYHVVGCYPNVSTRFDHMSTLTLSYCGEVVGGQLRSSIEGEPYWVDESELRGMLESRYGNILDDYLEHRKQHADQKSRELMAQDTTNEKL